MEKTSEEIRKGLRPVRWLRNAAFLCFFGPIIFTATAVLINKSGLFSTHFLVSGAPWTHRFWNWTFNIFALGCALLLLNRARACPRCQKGFFVRHGWNPRKKTRDQGRTGAWFNVNVFGRVCLNCGLKLDGSNADEKWVGIPEG
jgi:hypothetical protein